MNFVAVKKVGFIGAGQMAQAFIKAWLDSGRLQKEQIYIASRTQARLDKVVEKFGINSCPTNEDLVDTVDIIVLATKPQDLVGAVEPIAMSFEDKFVISLAAGFSLPLLKKTLPGCDRIARVMANTPVKIQKGVLGYALTKEAEPLEDTLCSLLEPLGTVLSVPDGEEFQALTIAAASGTGFVLELMQYWQDWIEGYGLSPEIAKTITTHTFLGTALLAEKQSQQSFEELQSQVVSKKGTTAAGLDSIRENDVERLLRLSFEKAALRDSELGASSQRK